MKREFRKLICLLVSVMAAVAWCSHAEAAEKPIRVLFVGGDWKSQLPNYQGSRPLRGFFVRQEVARAAPGEFEFTLWTSYEFLQYANAKNLKRFDVIVAGDVMGQSFVPRVVEGMKAFVEGGGGFLYCDNHKAFSFNTVEDSLDAVLPIKVVPFRPYGPEACQPMVKAEKPFVPTLVAPKHPVVAGLDWATAPGLQGARHGEVKAGAEVIATGPGKEPIWVAWDCGKGRALWLGGVFANDELSTEFATWPKFGAFYAQTLRWLAANSPYPRVALAPAVAKATLRVDWSKPGPAITPRHFGIHGQELAPNGAAPKMEGEDLALYEQLHLQGTFARTGNLTGIKPAPGEGRNSMDDGTDLTTFDAAKYDWTGADLVLADLKRIQAEPVFLYWCPWYGPNWPDSGRYTKYFAASLAHVNGVPPKADPYLKWFEIMNEPNLSPATEVLPRYADFFNHAVKALRPLAPGVKFGCGGFFEWSYFQQILDRSAGQLDWLSRHPYGHTGEAVFRLQDRYLEYAKAKGYKDLKFIITEWDFWIYGEPAFDYIMTRWKPLLDRADTCLGSLHYRWREYQEGGYVFGVLGQFDQKYGELPPEWPNPGRNKPISYRYNAFWIMRDCRGTQYSATLDGPELNGALSPQAYAVATVKDGQMNVVIHYGYAMADLAAKARYDKMRVQVSLPIPTEVRGRTLTISRADCRQRQEEPTKTIEGDVLELNLELPALSAVSLTVR